jgi:hydrogenase expression/formation protein HypE
MNNKQDNLLPGKLPAQILDNLLSKINNTDHRVKVGAEIGEDAALLDIGDNFLVVTTDPITFATDLLGWYLVNINANDIAVTGAKPKWLTTTLLFPPHTNPEEISDIFDDIVDACKKIDVSIVGGHTEITDSISKPIAIGTMLGEVKKEEAVTTSGAKLGDRIIMTKGLGIEGTSILCRDLEKVLVGNGVSKTTIATGRNYLFDPGISIIKDVSTILETAKVNSMHDLTEGGISTGIIEMATASKVGVVINNDDLIITPITLECCKATSINPLGLLSSGALVATLKPSDVDDVIRALSKKNILCKNIGYVTEQKSKILLTSNKRTIEFPRFHRDELARCFDMFNS